jgi:hypothetical protein
MEERRDMDIPLIDTRIFDPVFAFGEEGLDFVA